MAISRANGDENEDKLKKLCESLLTGKNAQEIISQAVEFFGQETINQVAYHLSGQFDEGTLAFVKAECEKLIKA